MTSPRFPTIRWLLVSILQLSLTLLLVACAASESAESPGKGTLSPLDVYPVSLPKGGQILQQEGSRVLFLGSMIQRKTTREAVLFDTDAKQVVWRSQLPGSPTRALLLPQGDYILVTLPDKGDAHLLRLDGQTGETLWDIAVPSPALDALWRQKDGALLVSNGSELWRIDPADGATLSTLATRLSQNAQPGSVVLSSPSDDPQTIYLASDHVLQMLRLREDQATPQWQFSSAKFIVALQPIRFESGQEGVVILAHSHSYFVTPDGKLLWRIKNKDINYSPVAIPNARSAQMLVFGNFVKGVYVVDANGLKVHSPLPGGNVHILHIPMPIPNNILLGGVMVTPSPYRSVSGYLLAVRSLDNLFVYHLSPSGDLALLAATPIASMAEEGSIVQKGNMNPNYPPFLMDGGLAVTYADGIHSFSLTPEGAP